MTHKCGEPATTYAASKCITCGCWGDEHPGASAVAGGPSCVCTNLHYQGQQSQKEREEERIRAKGHYIRKASPPASHYCQQPSVYYAIPGEIWQCDICHRKWKFRMSLLDRLVSETGRWRLTR